MGVFAQPTGRFHAQRASKHLGNFATAVEAAIAYAEAVAVARPRKAEANAAVVNGGAALLQLVATDDSGMWARMRGLGSNRWGIVCWTRAQCHRAC